MTDIIKYEFHNNWMKDGKTIFYTTIETSAPASDVNIGSEVYFREITSSGNVLIKGTVQKNSMNWLVDRFISTTTLTHTVHIEVSKGTDLHALEELGKLYPIATSDS